MRKQLSKIVLILVIVALAFSVIACDNGKDPLPKDPVVTIEGTVSAASGVLSDVKVSMGEQSVVTNSSGNFFFSDVVITGNFDLTFEKDKYDTVTKTVGKSDISNSKISLTVTMLVTPVATGTVTGKVTNGSTDAGIADVAVKLSTKTVKTGADGTYSFSDVQIKTGTLTFTKDKFKSASKSYSSGSFKGEDKVCTINIELDEFGLLPGKDKVTLQEEYLTMKSITTKRLYTSSGMLVKDGWTVFDGDGSHDEIVEGLRLKSLGTYEEFGSYIYGKTTITAATAQLNIFGRTFGSDAIIGLKVIDVAADYTETFINEKNSTEIWKTFNHSGITESIYDLSAFVGKDVIIGFGAMAGEFTINSTSFTNKDCVYLFGTTTLTDLADVPKITEFGTFTTGGSLKIQDKFVSVGVAKVDNARWMFMDADQINWDGVATDKDSPLNSYIMAKADITRANAKMSIKYSTYNAAPAAALKISVFSTEGVKLDEFYREAPTSGEWATHTFDFSNAIGKEVILAIGTPRGNRMGIESIKFERLNYILTGTIAGITNFDATKLTAKVDSATYDLTGKVTESTYSIDLSVNNKILTFSYAGYIDYVVDLTKIGTISDSITKNITMLSEQEFALTVKVVDRDDRVVGDVTVTVGLTTFTQDPLSDVFTATMKKSDLNGKNISVVPGVSLKLYDVTLQMISSESLVGTSGEIIVILAEKEILVGNSYWELFEGKLLTLNDYLWSGKGNDFFSELWSTYGKYELQDEGNTLRRPDGGIGVDPNKYVSYFYGVKNISAANNILKFDARTHGEATDITTFGVSVLSEDGTLTVIKKDTYNSRVCKNFTYDLSAFNGKKVVVIIGIINVDGKDSQLVTTNVVFATSDTTSTKVLPNKTLEQLKSNPALTLTYFDGQLMNKEQSSYIPKQWTQVIKGGDFGRFEFAPEGYLIGTTMHGEDKKSADYESYIFANFDITTDKNMLAFSARTFSTAIANFALTVIKSDGTVVLCTPIEGSSGMPDATDNSTGWWNFEGDDFGTFTYDLSQFEGQKVTISIGIRDNIGENVEFKLAIKQIQLFKKGVSNTLNNLTGVEITNNIYTSATPEAANAMQADWQGRGFKGAYQNVTTGINLFSHKFPIASDPAYPATTDYLSFIFGSKTISDNDILTFNYVAHNNVQSRFKVTVIAADGTATVLAPTAKTADVYYDTVNKIIGHDSDNAAGVGTASYDLSAFTGVKITIVFGVVDQTDDYSVRNETRLEVKGISFTA